MKILFGGSFDPIHIGHIYLIQKVIEEYMPKKIIIVPAYQSIGKKTYVFDYNFRLELISKALSTLSAELRRYIEISDYELKQRRPVFTYETVLQLKPDTLIVGSDINYTEWKYFYEVIDNYINHIIVFKRTGYLNGAKYKKEIIIDNYLSNISSSEIKKRLYLCERIGNLVPPSIIADIGKYFRKHYLIRNIN